MRSGDPAWLAHDRRGSGPPLVLLHGIGSRWQVWGPVLDAVAGHREVIAVDLPGFGASPPDAGPATVSGLADRVTGFMTALGLARPHLGGSSLGGGVALELARRGLAESVVAFAPVGFWGTPGRLWCQAVVRTARDLARALGPAVPRLVANRAGRAALCGVFYARPGRLDPADCVADAAALGGAAGFDAAWTGLADRKMFGTRSTRDLGHLAATPLTIAWGTRDAVLPYRTQARRARAMLPGARHVALRGCGHLPFSDDPEACARLLGA